MPTKWLIDSLLPERELHLMAGPSGAGKTRWLFDSILQWEQGLPVLGRASNPCPWIYIASDRSQEAAWRTLDDMGIDRNRIPLIPAWDDDLGLNGIFDEIEKSKVGLAIIESFGSFVEQPTGKCVKQLIHRTWNFMRKAQCTIIGVVESPKLKPHEKYENPRQRVSGAAAWSHHSDTIFLMEPTNPKMPNDPYRTLNVCPRTGPGMVVELFFDRDGRLYPAKLAEQIRSIKKST